MSLCKRERTCATNIHQLDKAKEKRSKTNIYGNTKKNTPIDTPMMADRLEILIEKGDIKIHIPLEPVLKELHTVITKLGQAI